MRTEETNVRRRAVIHRFPLERRTGAPGPVVLTTPKRLILLAAPVLVLVSTYVAFQGFVDLSGPRLGYFLGFLFYWGAWCLAVPWWILGRRGLASLFRPPRPLVGRQRWVVLALLSLPLLLAYTAVFPRLLLEANVVVILASAAIAVVNGTVEEVLWRGLYLRAFPGQLWLGYLWPTLGFAVWHVASQSIAPSQYPGGPVAFVVAYGVLGLMWGWIAQQTGSIRTAVFAHVLFEFAGLGGLLYFGARALA